MTEECKGDGSCGACQENEGKVEYKFDPEIDKPAWDRYDIDRVRDPILMRGENAEEEQQSIIEAAKKAHEELSALDKPVWERVGFVVDKEAVKAMDVQVGGNHYKNFEIQPTEFSMRNNLSFLQGCIIKRICRYKLKGMAREDLEKAKHEIDMIIELEGL